MHNQVDILEDIVLLPSLFWRTHVYSLNHTPDLHEALHVPLASVTGPKAPAEIYTIASD